jgi:hypothetical protein
MAVSTAELRRPGKTIFGSTSLKRPPSGVAVYSPSGKVSYLSLVDTAGTEYFLWFDTNGKLRTGTTNPGTLADPNTSGTIVGTQS